jgi:hypothetical protein
MPSNADWDMWGFREDYQPTQQVKAKRPSDENRPPSRRRQVNENEESFEDILQRLQRRFGIENDPPPKKVAKPKKKPARKPPAAKKPEETPKPRTVHERLMGEDEY